VMSSASVSRIGDLSGCSLDFVTLAGYVAARVVAIIRALLACVE